MRKAVRIAVLVFAVLLSPRAFAEPAGVIRPGHESQIVQLFEPPDAGGVVSPGLALGGMSIEAHGFSAALTPLAGGTDVQVRVLHAPQKNPPVEVTVTPDPATLPAPVRASIALLHERLQREANQAFWQQLLSNPEEERHDAPERFEDPHSPSGTLLCAISLACLLLVLLLDRFAQKAWAAAIAVLLALVPIGAWWHLLRPPEGTTKPGFLTQWAQWRESQLVRAVLLVLLAAMAIALVQAALRAWRIGWRPGAAALDAALVLAWSLVVRVGLTTANILTDGGTGYTRLLHYSRGYSGLAVLVSLVMPDAPILQAIWIPRLLAACTAPVVLLVARSLGLPRATALLAGLAVASLPVHAALYASDFEVGAIVMLSTAAVGLVIAGRQRASAPLVALGFALAAYALWGRPEALSIGALLLLALIDRPQRWWARPVVVAAAAWLLALALVRLSALASLSLTDAGARTLEGPWYAMPLREWIRSQALLPWWLWAPAIVGVVLLRGRTRLLVVAGLALGLLPLHLTPLDHDPTRTFVEFFRYATGALPWLAIASAAGLFAIAHRFGQRTEPVLVALCALAMLATPVAQRAYLAREYGPTMEARVFREVLRQVPAECTLAVPDDGDEAGEGHSMEVLGRYRAIAHEARVAGEAVVSNEHVVGMHQLLAGVAPDGCLYVFRGAWCEEGLDGTAPRVCDDVLARLPLAEVARPVALYRSHRLVTAPERTDAPFFTPALALPLYRRVTEKQADR